MKKILVLFIIIICLLGFGTVCYAETSAPDGLVYDTMITDWDNDPDTPDERIAYITGYDGTDSTLNIPKTVNVGGEDIPVKYIAGAAFKDNQTIKHVSFALDTVNNIEKIYNHAFDGCINLESIDIPNTVNYVGSNAFEGCTLLESANLVCEMNTLYNSVFNGCTNLSSVSLSNTHLFEIQYDAFKDCTSLQTITIPTNVNDISSGAFDGCSSLASINTETLNDNYTSRNGVLYTEGITELIRFPQNKNLTTYDMPDTVSKVHYYALDDCKHLQTLNIPASVTSLYDDNGRLFTGSSNLKKINVDENNANFSSDTGGVLYNKDKTTLLRYPDNKVHGNNFTSYTVKDNVTKIIDCAFYGNKNLEQIIFPDSVLYVQNKIVANNMKINKLTFESSEEANYPIGIYDEDASNNYPNDIIIEGVAGSFSQTFANNNGFTFLELGNNTPPTVANEIPDGTATVGSTFTYVIPENTFADAENDALAYSMSTTNSDISYISSSREIRYTPTAEERVSITITATDTSGASASDTFNITAVKLPQFTTLSVSNITSNSAIVHFAVDEDCEYTIAVMSPREDENYNGPFWILSQGKITGNCAVEEEIQATVTHILSNDPVELQPGEEYAICIRVKDSADNYVIGHVLFTTIKGSNITIPEVPKLDSKTYYSVTLKNLEDYEYSRDNGQSWQDEAIFTGLSASTSYTFIQRIKETDSIYASSTNGKLEVTTNSRPSSGGGSSSSGGSYKPTVSGAKTISSTKKGEDTSILIKQENVEVTFNGLEFEDLKNKKVQAKIEEVAKDDLNLPKELEKQIENLPIFDISIYVDGEKEHFESDKPIVIEIPVETDKENHKIIAVYIDNIGDTQIMEGVLNDGVMKFTTNHLSNYALMYVDKSFDDVSTHWGKEAIEALVVREVVNGVSGDRFNPNGNITRAEFATLMVRYFGLTSSNKANYSDVKEGKWYTEYVSIAKNNGILPEIYGTTFEPIKTITREEMMYILYKSLEVSNKLESLNDNGDSLSDFTDSDIVSGYAIEGTEYLISRDIINGSGNGKLNPNGTSTRAEVAQILWNMINITK